MDCATFRERLWPFLDGALDSRDHAAARRHLEACPACARAAGRARELLRLVQRAGPEAAPAALRARVREILERAAPETRPEGARAPARPTVAPRPAPATPRRARGRWWVATALAAAVAAVLLLRPDAEAPFPAAGFAADHDQHAATAPSVTPFPEGTAAPPAPRLSEGTRTGVSRCVIGGRVYAHTTVRTRAGLVSVFVPQDDGGPMPTSGSARRVDGTVALAVGPAGAPARAVLVSTDVPPAALSRLYDGA